MRPPSVRTQVAPTPVASRHRLATPVRLDWSASEMSKTSSSSASVLTATCSTIKKACARASATYCGTAAMPPTTVHVHALMLSPTDRRAAHTVTPPGTWSAIGLERAAQTNQAAVSGATTSAASSAPRAKIALSFATSAFQWATNPTRSRCSHARSRTRTGSRAPAVPRMCPQSAVAVAQGQCFRRGIQSHPLALRWSPSVKALLPRRRPHCLRLGQLVTAPATPASAIA